MARRKLRVAAVQMPVTPDVDANMMRIAGILAALARRRVHVATFPECAASGYLIRPEKLDAARLRRATGELRSLARRHRIALVAGTTEIRRGRAYNTALAIEKTGRIVMRYDKAHLIGDDAKCYGRGRRLPRVFRLAGARVAIEICYDVRFPELARLAALGGAQVLFTLFNAGGRAAWKKPVLSALVRARAAENAIWHVAPNAVHRVQMVASAIVRPDGLAAAEARPAERPAVLVADLDLSRATRALLADRRPGLYEMRRRAARRGKARKGRGKRA